MAGRLRFADDPNTPDSGNGMPPVVDIGAYEYHDCNANGTRDEDDIAHGSSEDCNANGVPDECLDLEVDCNENLEPDTCDIADGSSDDCNGNGCPDECDIADAISPDADDDGIPDECYIANSHVSFAPDPGTSSVAYQVTLAASLEFPQSVGLSWRVGAPDQNNISRLVGSPVFRDWSGDPAAVHVGDCEIVPVATYQLRSTVDGVEFSDAITLATIHKPGPRYYGDVVGVGTGKLPPLSGFTPPTGVVNVTDVQAYILKFQGPSSPNAHATWVDLHGDGPGSPPDFIINVSDLQRIKFGFQGQRYTNAPDHLNPADCP